MKQVFIFHFVLLVLFYLSTVHAKGQMFLDNINPVKETTVHFNDHVETSDAVFTTLSTENFELLKQYEPTLKFLILLLTLETISISSVNLEPPYLLLMEILL